MAIKFESLDLHVEIEGPWVRRRVGPPHRVVEPMASETRADRLGVQDDFRRAEPALPLCLPSFVLRRFRERITGFFHRRIDDLERIVVRRFFRMLCEELRTSAMRSRAASRALQCSPGKTRCFIPRIRFCVAVAWRSRRETRSPFVMDPGGRRRGVGLTAEMGRLTTLIFDQAELLDGGWGFQRPVPDGNGRESVPCFFALVNDKGL